MVVYLVHDHEPMPRWRLGIRTIGPEFCEHARVVATRHYLRRVGSAGNRIDGMPCARVSAIQQVVELRILARIGRIHLNIADAGRGNVHHDAVGLIEMG